MFLTPTEHTAAATTDFEAGAVLLAGPAAAAETEVAALLLATSAAVLGLTGTAIEIVAVLGVLVWVVALMVLVAVDLSRARHRGHTRQHGRKRQRRVTLHGWWGRR